MIMIADISSENCSFDNLNMLLRALGDKMNERREQRNARKDLGNADIEVNRRYRSKEL